MAESVVENLPPGFQIKEELDLTEVELISLRVLRERQSELYEQHIKPVDDSFNRLMHLLAQRLGVDPRSMIVNLDIGRVAILEQTGNHTGPDLLIPRDPRMIKSIESARGKTPKVKS